MNNRDGSQWLLVLLVFVVASSEWHLSGGGNEPRVEIRVKKNAEKERDGKML